MIYVDEPVFYAHKPFGHYYWSHLWTDGEVEELHTFILSIGMRRSWFQPAKTPSGKYSLPHYDVTGSKYILALRKGAVLTSLREFFANRLLPTITDTQKAE